ncbi:transcriptional Coactivator p15-domain-containing protein [Gautieria morchelliformis]|nr:transcriptional Coactivator p15-domain-containing protein [Gautieria morchelliformis]
MSKRSAEPEEAEVSSKKVKRSGDASDSGAKPDSNVKKASNGNSILDLGNMKRATVSVFKGNAQVDIREYYTDKNGDVKPGKKGITLNRSQWDMFLSGIDSLSEQLKTIDTDKGEEASKAKKKSGEKTTKTKKKSEKPTKKKKKDESEEEASDNE